MSCRFLKKECSKPTILHAGLKMVIGESLNATENLPLMAKRLTLVAKRQPAHGLPSHFMSGSPKSALKVIHLCFSFCWTTSVRWCPRPQQNKDTMWWQHCVLRCCPSVAKRGNIVARCVDTTNVSEIFRNIVCVQDTKFVCGKMCQHLGNMITSAMLPPQCVLILPAPKSCSSVTSWQL